jgi:hypothetical protein
MHERGQRPSAIPRKYAVLWSNGDGILKSGRLETLPDRIELSSRGTTLMVAFDEVREAYIGRGSGDRLRGLPALVLDHGSRGRLLVASLEGTGALYEIAGLFDGAAVSTPVAIGT